jgi:hypothetical protein
VGVSSKLTTGVSRELTTGVSSELERGTGKEAEHRQEVSPLGELKYRPMH